MHGARRATRSGLALAAGAGAGRARADGDAGRGPDVGAPLAGALQVSEAERGAGSGDWRARSPWLRGAWGRGAQGDAGRSEGSPPTQGKSRVLGGMDSGVTALSDF